MPMYERMMRPAQSIRIAIWGVGLIGGSLGMAWRRAGVASEVIGIGRSPLDEAVRMGAIDRYVCDPAEGLSQADVIVLAAPVRAIIAQAELYGRHIAPGAVVTDVGSTKQEIVSTWESFLPLGASFVGGHPMFGREVGGVSNASPDLVRGCRYIITPGERAAPAAVRLVSHLATAAGAVVEQLSPAEHDARIAIASHLPQVVATALADAALAGDEQLGRVLNLAGAGFRDTTRIAGSPAQMWLDIFATNLPAIRRALQLFQVSLDQLRAAIESGQMAAVEAIFDRAHEARSRLR